MDIYQAKTRNLDRGITDFLNCYLTYFQYNEGLRCHFFQKRTLVKTPKTLARSCYL